MRNIFASSNTGFRFFLNLFTVRGDELKSRFFPLFLRYILFICVLVLIAWGLKRVWCSLTNLNIFWVSPATFSFQTPLWATDRISYDIKHIKSLNEHYNIYENGLSQKIAEIYGGLVFVKRVDSIKRIFPNRLNIKLILRKPVAIVRSGKDTYLIDDEYVLLPKQYYTLPNSGYENPCIQSNRLSGLPPYGSVWNDEGIKVGVELIKFLRLNNIHNLFKILVVDVSNVCKKQYRGKSDIILWTENNVQILWGCSPLCKTPDELSDEEKLQNLLSVAKVEGTSLKYMEYVDVRWKKPLGKRWVQANNHNE
ncbi:MAG: hypothetical protein E3K32_03210 [wastewater metagenome]|nr:hypothetical protein [Candidatus Loosdrechtia aerotolerans]